MAAAYLTVAEKAAELGVSRDSIYRHADALGAVRIGRALRFPPGVPAATPAPPTPVEPAPVVPAKPRRANTAAPARRYVRSAASFSLDRGRSR